LEPLDLPSRGDDLWSAACADLTGETWTYLSAGPFASRADFDAWLVGFTRSPDPLGFAIVDATSGRAVGVACYLRITPAHGAIEIGHLYFSRLLQRTAAASEAVFLLIRSAFDNGYRRVEWKCDDLNAASRAAAERFGFRYEGTFRQAIVKSAMR
jgi:RimJ/RimL family protein N-acetyltransferase